MGRKYLEPEHPLYNHFASRRGAAQAAGEIYSFEMGGNIYPVGIYWTGLGLGTPQQNFQAAVDSGSSDLIIPSASCTVNLFNLLLSNRYNLFINIKRDVTFKTQEYTMKQQALLPFQSLAKMKL